MQVKFLVQNPHRIPVSKQVEIDGEPMAVAIEGFEVHLLSVDGMSGTLVLRYFGSQAREAEKLFAVDAIAVAEISVEAPADSAAVAEEPAA